MIMKENQKKKKNPFSCFHVPATICMESDIKVRTIREV